MMAKMFSEAHVIAATRNPDLIYPWQSKRILDLSILAVFGFPN